jgi:signal transduction histidine kinase
MARAPGCALRWRLGQPGLPMGYRRIAMGGLAADEAALRRVATLVARQAPQGEIFGAIAEELTGLLGAGTQSAIFHPPDDSSTAVVVGGERLAAGVPMDAALLEEASPLTARVLRERRPARVDEPSRSRRDAEQARKPLVRSTVGCPIVVQGRPWGAMLVARLAPDPLPPETEGRVSQFGELVSIAIANAEASAEGRRLFEEQAALRRVATLVAEGAPPSAVLDAVVVEVAQLLGAAQVGLARYESGQEISVLAMRGHDSSLVRTGMRLPLEGDNLSSRVLRSGSSARFDHRVEGQGRLAEVVRGNDISITVGAPIFVDGALWGMIGASWKGADRPPPDSEERLTQFAQLVDTAIASADTRAQLTASRARVISAGNEARRRVVRDLHDGAQQRLVHAIVALKLTQRAVDEDPERVKVLLAEALSHAEQGNEDLRELAHGILPSVLTRGGLRSGVDSIVSRLDLPVDVEVTRTRLPPDIEASAYFVVAEALTNVVKHSRAGTAKVVAVLDSGILRLEVRDDGIGAANAEGPGLTGIGDRVAALGGSLRIDSPPGMGTVLIAEVPLAT